MSTTSVFAGQPAETGPEPLVSLADFAEWYGITLPDPLPSPLTGVSARVQTAIEIASEMVRRGRRVFTLVTGDVVTLDGPGGRDLLLPQDRLPVRSVTSITNRGRWDTSAVTVDAADYDWSASGIIRLRRGATLGHCWSSLSRGIVVTYTHGYTIIPRDVAGVVLSIAKRLYDNPAGSTVRSETLGDYSVTYDATAGGLLPHEELILSQYEVPA